MDCRNSVWIWSRVTCTAMCVGHSSLHQNTLLVKRNHLPFSSVCFCFKVTVSFHYRVINCVTWLLLVNTEFIFISLYWINGYEDWEEGHWTCCNSSFHWPNHQSLFVTVANWDQLLLDIYLESFSNRYLNILSGTTSYSGQGKTTRVKLLRHLAFVFSSSYISLWSFLHQHFPQSATVWSVQEIFHKGRAPQPI